ncbi:hypothetical protein ACFQ0M_27905 [Kitasatospora aburaviensis]
MVLTLHRAALVLPDPADPTAPSVADGAVLVQDGRIAALGPREELAAAHPGARLRDWGTALLTPGLRNPYGHRLLEHAYHPDPREGSGTHRCPGRSPARPTRRAAVRAPGAGCSGCSGAE